MIEVEKKFNADPAAIARLVRGAALLSDKSHTDIYFDTATYDFTKKSWWFRKRDGRFELKIPIGAIREQGFTQYDEIENDELIAERLGFARDERPLEAFFEGRGLRPFATLVTHRRKYKKDGLSIDVDEVDFGFAVVEIEAMIDHKHEVGDALDRIMKTAIAAGLTASPDSQARGKVLEYLYRNAPEHFKALEEAWGMPI